MEDQILSSNYVLDIEKDIWLRFDYAGISYSDGDEAELHIAGIIEQAADITVLSTELRQHCTDWPTLYHLSGTRANILRPFAASLTGDILEIGAGCGAITRYLGECGANVLALEGSQRRATIARSRTRDLENVTVLAEKFDQFQCDHRFDVITLIGVLEYANLFTTSENPALAMLRRVRTLLKSDGKLIIAIENQLGLKYFAGAPEDHLGQPMYGIEGRYREDQPQTFGRAVLADILKEAGFAKSEFLAPFPDYKLPVSILTEEGLSNKKFDGAALAWQSVRHDHQLPPRTNFSLELAWSEVFANGLALNMANSFLIVASPLQRQVVEPGFLGYHYSTDRAPPFCKETVFKYIDESTIIVNYHMLRDHKDDGRNEIINFSCPVSAAYAVGVPLSFEFIKIVTRDGWSIEEVGTFIQRYINLLILVADKKGKLIGTSKLTDKLTGDFFDLVPQNIIVDHGGQPIPIDSEWSLNDDIELGWLLFRTLLLTIESVTHFGKNSTALAFSRRTFVKSALNAAGYSCTDEDLLRFIKLEAIIQQQVAGRSSEDFLNWLPEQPLPVNLIVEQNAVVVERDEKISSLNEIIAERGNRIVGLNQAVIERDDGIANLNQAVLERDSRIADLNQATIERYNGIPDLGQAVVERDNRIAYLDRALIECDNRIAKLDKAIVERDNRIAKLDQAVVERDKRTARLDRTLIERDNRIASLDQAQFEIDTRIAALENSTFWKITFPLRRALTGTPTVRKFCRRTVKVVWWASTFQLGERLLEWRARNMARVGVPHVELFDAGFYLKKYPDVAIAGIDPYEHFVNFGRKEGRICISAQPSKLECWDAHKVLNPTRKTVLVVTHEASRTGAPMLSLNIVQELKKKYNVITLLLLNSGEIADNFRHSSDIVIAPVIGGRNPDSVASFVDQLLARHNVSFAIVNSIESRSALPVLARRFVPTVTLIHEFASYTRPKDAFREAIFWSTETVFSAPLTYENAVSEYPELNSCQFHIIPQGRCALPSLENERASRLEEDAKILGTLRPAGLPKDTVIVLGAGTVELRKGVDLFIACAAKVVQSRPSEHFRFVWIGKGYDPEHDGAYSAYLSDQIRRSELQGHVFFLEATSSIEAAYQAVDIFLLSPRLDPLPNVAIDAMAHGLPVVCFEKATGIADILIENGFGEVCVAPYFETSKLASNILALIQSKTLRQKVGKELQQLALSQFNMEHYVKQLEELTLDAGKRITQEQTDILEIINSGLPRLCFLEGQQLDEAVRFYVRSWASGVWRKKLFPGFQPGIFLEQSGMREPADDPLANYLRAGQPDGPWRYDVITSEEIAQSVPGTTRIALHLHVYYPDQLPEILSRLSGNNIRPDLFVSVPTKLVRDEIVELLYDYSGKVMDIQIVPNRGRDIGPFLTVFGTVFLDHYDVVGHLHTKKSIELKDELIGKNWCRFLLENLLGGKKNMADIILGHMATDPSIGIVFPDDPHVVGWNSNKSYAEILGQQLGLGTLPENFVFPVGTMFWARVHALRPIFNLGLTWQDYPTEPLPNDGTVLHVLERLLPFVAAKQSTRSVLTSVTGITR